jgi:hypothetical protein
MEKTALNNGTLRYRTPGQNIRNNRPLNPDEFLKFNHNILGETVQARGHRDGWIHFHDNVRVDSLQLVHLLTPHKLVRSPSLYVSQQGETFTLVKTFRDTKILAER